MMPKTLPFLVSGLLGLVMWTGCLCHPAETQRPSTTPKLTVAPTMERPCVLFFSAAWCSACRAAKPAAEALREKGVDVRMVDCDQNPELVRRHDVTLIPCFIYGDQRTNDPQVALSWFE